MVGSRMNSRILASSHHLVAAAQDLYIGIAPGCRGLAGANSSDASVSDEKRYSRRPRKVKIVGAQPLQNWLAWRSRRSARGGLELKVLIVCRHGRAWLASPVTQARTR